MRKTDVLWLKPQKDERVKPGMRYKSYKVEVLIKQSAESYMQSRTMRLKMSNVEVT